MLSRAVPAVLAAVGVMLMAGGCSPENVKARLKPPEKRNKAPEFELRDSMGKAVKLSDYLGKIVLLNFWATWCGPCKIEVPWFADFEQRYKDQGFAVLGISMDEDGWDAVKPFLRRYQVNYRVLLGDDSVATLYGGVESLPTTFVIDREGRIASTHVGLVSKSAYQNDLNLLLGFGQTSRRPRGPALLPALVSASR